MHRSKQKYDVLVMKPACNTPLTRPKSTLEDNIKTHLKETW